MLYDTTALIFLSTLSLRRATLCYVVVSQLQYNFYPRSPCGERRCRCPPRHWHGGFLSTLSLRRATILGNPCAGCPAISIHALLAESDCRFFRFFGRKKYFYPRSPCGERQRANRLAHAPPQFLSTLSLRRATAKVHKTMGHFCTYETNFMGIASSC